MAGRKGSSFPIDTTPGVGSNKFIFGLDNDEPVATQRNVRYNNSDFVSYWDRNPTTKVIFPVTLLDKVAIGQNSAVATLDIKESIGIELSGTMQTGLVASGRELNQSSPDLNVSIIDMDIIQSLVPGSLVDVVSVDAPALNVSEEPLTVVTTFVASYNTATTSDSSVNDGSISIASGIVQGTTSLFTTELVVGDIIQSADGQTRTVTEIISNTVLRVNTPFSPKIDFLSKLSRTIDPFIIRDETNSIQFIATKEGRFGIGGVELPLGTVHVQTSTAGVITPDVDGDDLVVENSANNANAGISILAGNGTGISSLFFGNAASPKGGRIIYDNAAGAMLIHTDNSTNPVIEIDSLGNLVVGNNLPIGGLGLITITRGNPGVGGDIDNDELVIEGLATSGISILTNTTGKSAITFKSSGTDQIGKIKYDQFLQEFNFLVKNKPNITLREFGATIPGELTVGTGDPTPFAATGVFDFAYATDDNLVLYFPFSESNSASAHAIVSDNYITTLTVTNGGSGYTEGDVVRFLGGSGSDAQAIVTGTGAITALTILHGGNGFTVGNVLSIFGGTGSGATATVATISDKEVIQIDVVDGFSGYSVAPAVVIDPPGRTAVIVVTISGGAVNAVFIQDSGSNYASPPILVVAPGTSTTLATLTAVLLNGEVIDVIVTEPGAGYTTAPAVTVPVVGVTATATSTITNGVVTSITITNGGTNYVVTPTVPAPFVAISPTSNTTVFDRSPYGNDGTTTGNALINSTAGKYGNGLNLDKSGTGANATIVRVPTSPILEEVTSFTAEWWMNPNTNGGSFEPIISKTDSGTGKGWNLTYQSQSIRTTFRRADTGGFDDVFLGGGSIAIQKWSHVAVSFDINTRLLNLYVNGKNEGEARLTGAWDDNGTDLVIGARLSSGNPINLFNGKLSEVKLYHRVLNLAEIRTHWQKGNSSLALGTIKADKFRINNTADITKFIVSDGNVGINIPNPTVPLEMKGGVTIDLSGKMQDGLIDDNVTISTFEATFGLVTIISTLGSLVNGSLVDVTNAGNGSQNNATVSEIATSPNGFKYGVFPLNTTIFQTEAIVSIAAGIVQGTNTSFTSELAVGDVVITTTGQLRTVTEIISDTLIRVNAPFSPKLDFDSTLQKVIPHVLIRDINNNIQFSINHAGHVGIGNVLPDPSAALDVETTNKGILFPRLTTAQKLLISSPATGLILFDTDKKSLAQRSPTEWRTLATNADTDHDVFSELDIGIESGGTVTIQSGRYVLKKGFTTTNKWKTAPGANVTIESFDRNNTIITYTGNGTFLDFTSVASATINNIQMILTDNAANLYTHSGGLFAGNTFFVDWTGGTVTGKIGNSTNGFAVVINNSIMTGFLNGITLENVQFSELSTLNWTSKGTGTGTMFAYKGTGQGHSLSGVARLAIGANETLIDAETTIVAGIAVLNIEKWNKVGTGDYFPTVTTKNITAFAQAGEAANSVTDVSDTAGNPIFTKSGTVVYSPGDTIVHVGFNEGTYNGTFIIDEYNSGTFQYDLTPVLVAVPTPGALGTVEKPKTTVTVIAHGYSNGQDVQITGSDNNDGSFVISDVTTDTFEIVSRFVATGTGIVADGLNQKSPGVTVSNSVGSPNSTVRGGWKVLGKTTGSTPMATTATDFTDINFVGNGTLTDIVGSERIRVSDAATGTIEYFGRELDKILRIPLFFNATGNANKSYFLKIFVDKGAGFVEMSDIFPFPLLFGSGVTFVMAEISKEVVANPGWKFKWQIAGQSVGDSQDVTFDNCQMDV